MEEGFIECTYWCINPRPKASEDNKSWLGGSVVGLMAEDQELLCGGFFGVAQWFSMHHRRSGQGGA